MFDRLGAIFIFVVFGALCFMGGVDCATTLRENAKPAYEDCHCDCGFDRTAYNSGWVEMEFPFEVVNSPSQPVFGTITLWAFVENGAAKTSGPITVNLGPIE